MRVAAALLIILAIFAIGAACLTWMNRASEKILTAVIPIGTAAVVGIVLSVFVFGGEPSTSLGFPASFQYQSRTKTPANLPVALMSRRFTSSLFAPGELYRSHPEYFCDPKDANGTQLYHDLLFQKSIIDWLAQHYRVSWQYESISFESSVGRGGRFGPPENASELSTIYAPEDVQQMMRGNKFADVNSSGPAPQIAVPQGTTLTITPPNLDSNRSQTGQIRLTNKFCELSIKTSFSWYCAGVGTLKSMAGLTDEEDEALGTATYTVTVNIAFSPLRSGHPKMPVYKKWAIDIANGIQDQFDERTIWTRTLIPIIYS